MSEVVAKPPRFTRSRRLWYGAAGVLIAGILAVSHSLWLPYLKGLAAQPKGEAAKTDEHAGHDHGGHAEVTSVKLSQQARKNIGLSVGTIALTSFDRTISIPGIIVERPGRSLVEVTAPLTGIITRIYPILGEAVRPGQKLFDVRVTHEELVQAQADFLRTAEELDVIGREIDRLEKVALEGVVAGKALLERQYEQQKQLAVQRAQRQALLLHGLSEQQVQDILSSRTLLSGLTVSAPLNAPDGMTETIFQVQELKVARGQHVNVGETLAVLADHAELLIQGNAFEKDAPLLADAVRLGTRVAAVIDAEDRKPEIVSNLSILYLSGKIDAESRALHFYITLPNVSLKTPGPQDAHDFIYWQFRPGQRMQIQIPVERWTDRIVLPIDAIAQDGAETYVFQQNGDNFVRRSVHVEYRDPSTVVIANDGSLFPGDQVALSAAQQLQLEIKNKAGGGIDPHAGHNH